MTHCFIHGNKESAFTCTECGRPFCVACITMVEGESICELCWERHLSEARPLAPDPQVQYVTSVPWNHWRELGPVNAFYQTAIQTLLQPQLFFTKINSRAGVSAALAFAALCVMLFWYPVNLFYIKYFFPPVLEMMNKMADDSATIAMLQTAQARYESLGPLDIYLAPLVVLINSFILTSLIQQFMIRLFHGRHGYGTTLQIRCYAMISQCLWFIPLAGFILAELGSLIISSHGFHIAQGLPRTKAFLVALVPTILYLFVVTFAM